MQIEDNNVECINISALDIETLLPEGKEIMKENVMLDDKDREMCKQVVVEGNINKGYTIQDELLCWRNRVYVLQGFRQRVMQSEQDLKIAGHFGREPTMKLVTSNFYRANMERDIQKYCSEWDICQRTKAPRLAKHGLLHALELACNPWTHISTDFITHLLESEGATMILVEVDRFTKMAHFVPIKKKDSPSVVRAYLENVSKYRRFPEDVVLDQDSPFMGSFFSDLYNYLGIKCSMSTVDHSQTDGQTDLINQVIESYLRFYCNYKQHNCASMLAMAEYAYNNLKHSSTTILPCNPNYGFEPCTSWPTEVQFKNPASALFGRYLVNVHKKLGLRLDESISAMQKYNDEKRKPIQPSKTRDFILLNRRNI
jgi:hypothetical protein